MIAISVQSGSNGNCIYVEGGGARILFDAGISGIRAQQRLAALGRDIARAHAVVISHDHSDHVKCAGVYARKFKLPVHVTRRTLDEALRWHRLGHIEDIRHFESGQSLRVADAVVHTVPTPHDASDGVAFVVEADGRRLGILTDLGHVFDPLPRLIGTLDAVFIESNYDPDMLEDGWYPEHLKRRIRGPRGHLSNGEAAELLRGACGRLKWAALAHLSEENNSPQLAMRTARSMAPRGLPLLVAGRYEASNVLEV